MKKLMHQRIALVKIGWSEQYQGGPVLGRFDFIQNFNEAHERFNFIRHSNNFYGYIHPIGATERPPQPTIKEGWLVIFVSARNGNGPLTVVGWYDNARFYDNYHERPEYSTSEDFETDVRGEKYVYCLSADIGHLIPEESRVHTVHGRHFGHAPVLYVRGNNHDDAWRSDLADFAEAIVDQSPESESLPPKLSFPDTEYRRRVERAAIDSAKEFLRNSSYRVTDRQNDKCGYDLLARHNTTDDELHIEVKGTSGSNMHFYMSRNEFLYMPSPKWRLLMVTDALNTPNVTMMNSAEVRRAFNFDEFAWEATAK